MAQQNDQFKKIIAHCKEYGFIYQSSEVYDGLSAVYDYGPLGSLLKNNIKEYWWKSMVQMNNNIVGIDAAIFMHPKTWKASGHVDAFNDPLVDNKTSNKRYRADVLVEDYMAKIEAKINKEVAKYALDNLDIDDHGLDLIDRKFLTIIMENFDGGPVGIDNLCASLGESKDTIEDVIEPYLIQEGFLQRTPRGRMITRNTMEYLNIKEKKSLWNN